MNAPAPSLGSVIAEKYRVERVLGSGGMAVVVEATHLLLGQRVALKLLRADAARAPGVLERFFQEAQIAAQLPGEHIVRVTDLGKTEGGAPFIVMELLVGRDLEAEIVARRWLPMEEAVDVLLQACEGVAEAHAKGLVHRDLKPGNLFFMRRRDGSPLIKVLDFGISKLMGQSDAVSLTQTTSNFGTPLFMSPEQIQSVKHVDARCDQHALGAILYTMLAGRPPFDAPTVTALSVLIATQPPPSLVAARPDVPARLEAVILRALAKQPGDRFPDLAALAYALAPFGSAGAQASVRRVMSTLASAPPPFPSYPGAPAPPTSGAGYSAAPPADLPRVAIAEQALQVVTSGHSSGLIPIPGRPSEPSGAPLPPLPPPRPSASMGQTSPALTTALDRERAASSRRIPLAIAFVSLTALLVAAVVGLVLFRFGPKRAQDAAAAPAVEIAPPAAPPSVEPPAPPALPAPEVSAAEPALPAPSPSPSPTDTAAPEPSPTEPSASAAPAPATSAAPKATASLPAKPLPSAPRSSSTVAKPPATKKRDPGEIFGAKR